MRYEDVLGNLKEKVDYDLYVISKEFHNDGGVHFHVILVGKKKFDIKTPTMLDLKYEGETYHGKYETVKGFTRCVEYVCKFGKYDTNIPDIIDGIIMSPNKRFELIANTESIENAQLWYMENHPIMAAGGKSLDKLTKIYRYKQALELQMQTPMKKFPFRSLQQFNLPENVVKWLEQGCMPTLILEGEGGTEKTSFARMLANVLNQKMLTLSHKEDFKKLRNMMIAMIFYFLMIFASMISLERSF